ncbi:hypothetical protein G3I40_12205 [Streptomyces sp. SID14478]|uniref:hypothetical protein n=1 Tax=Streptomyces sp. SID14478 TaxID=2706073 RepID=UPI0013DCB300|nr:hypothetical protein [Streptomyces sp. SID14478]NEB75977.1 hypothetical protein [Streptomyces sp. SID14478]
MSATALDATGILDALDKLPEVTTIDQSVEQNSQLREWAQVLLPKARAVLKDLPEEEGGQRSAVTRIIGWALTVLDSTRPLATLSGATWQVGNLAMACRLLANVVASVAEGRVRCAWCKRYGDDARLIRVIEAASGPGASLFGCAPCRERFSLAPLTDRPGLAPPDSRDV